MRLSRVSAPISSLPGRGRSTRACISHDGGIRSGVRPVRFLPPIQVRIQVQGEAVTVWQIEGERGFRRNAAFAVLFVCSVSHSSESAAQGIGHGFTRSRERHETESRIAPFQGETEFKGRREGFAPFDLAGRLIVSALRALNGRWGGIFPVVDTTGRGCSGPSGLDANVVSRRSTRSVPGPEDRHLYCRGRQTPESGGHPHARPERAGTRRVTPVVRASNRLTSRAKRGSHQSQGSR